MLEKQWRYFVTAIMFMTRIPVGKAGSGDIEDLAGSTNYFPLVGVVVGSAIGLVFWLTQLVWANSIAVAICVICAVLLTGGFHEDGLADVADSAGAWTKEKKLEIMRDSRIGTYGGLALILSLMLSMVALVDVSNTTTEANSAVREVTATLILAHVLGRWSSLLLMHTTQYAREDAVNSVFVDKAKERLSIVGNLTTVVVVVACHHVLSSGAIIALVFSVLCTFFSRWWYIKKIGGITGDCLGATNKLVEVGVYLCIAAYLST